MKLVIYNGSPRGMGGNTFLLLEQFIRGFKKNNQNTVELYYLKNRDAGKDLTQAFMNADTVLLAFPLYADAMPGIVKEFIESLAPICGKRGNPKIGFIVQGGFPEGIHTLFIERYCKKLALRLGCEYIGTIRKGRGEGIRKRSEKKNAKLFKSFEDLGTIFGANGIFQKDIVEKLKQPEIFPKYIFPIIWFMRVLGLIDDIWDKDLKTNNAYAKRFDKPFL